MIVDIAKGQANIWAE